MNITILFLPLCAAFLCFSQNYFGRYGKFIAIISLSWSFLVNIYMLLL